jgi:hypothetical protein
MPVAAALTSKLLANGVPHLLGVDEHAVEVEDDEGHSATYRRSK